MNPLHLTDLMPFGKYSVKVSGVETSVESVIEGDIDYLTFLIEKHKVTLSDEAYEFYKNELENKSL